MVWKENTIIRVGKTKENSQAMSQEILSHTSFKTSSRQIYVFTDHFKAIVEKMSHFVPF
jgi:hypothetical protein